MRRLLFSILFLTFLLSSAGFVLAESTSTNYRMWGSAVVGGGGKTTSTNYIGFGSVGDALSSDRTNSANYRSYNGFEAIYEEPRITMSVSSTNLALSPSTLTVATVSTASTTVTVSTNADFGYTLTATETAPFANQSGDAIADVADSSVTAGSEEYGIAVSGSDAAFGTDQGISSTPLTIATKALWGADRATVVTVKAAIAPATEAGSYSGTITFIATGNF